MSSHYICILLINAIHVYNICYSSLFRIMTMALLSIKFALFAYYSRIIYIFIIYIISEQCTDYPLGIMGN